jgi:hypothetical protein
MSLHVLLLGSLFHPLRGPFDDPPHIQIPVLIEMIERDQKISDTSFSSSPLFVFED